MSDLRKQIAFAISDPGNAGEGYKGERTLTEWQVDAVMRVVDGLERDLNRIIMEREVAYAKVTCMCGSYVNEHGMGDGHSAVSQYDHALTQAEERGREAERDRCAKLIEGNMIVGERADKLIPRGNSGNTIGLAYAAAIRKGEA